MTERQGGRGQRDRGQGNRGLGDHRLGGRAWARHRKRVGLAGWMGAALVLLLAACASVSEQEAEQRPFYLPEYELESHGKKTWYDRAIDLDPALFDVEISDEFRQNPPVRIAVLPFLDRGTGQFILDKVPLTFHSKKVRDRWAWTDAQRLRRYMQSYLAQREFVLRNLTAVDAVLEAHGIDNGAKLKAVPPEELGRWLRVDAVMYGTVLAYENYWGFLISIPRVSVEGKLVSTADGHDLIRFEGSRERTNLLPATDPVDFVINSFETLLDLRDIQIARAEDEVCREIVARIPISETLRQRLIDEALEPPGLVDAGGDIGALPPD
jgi:hypothetical protein